MGINRFMTPAKLPQIGGFFQLPFEVMATSIQAAQKEQDTVKAGLYELGNTQFNYIPTPNNTKGAMSVYQGIQDKINSTLGKSKNGDLRGLTEDVLSLKYDIANRTKQGGDIYTLQTDYNSLTDWYAKQREKGAKLAPGFAEHILNANLESFDAAGGSLGAGKLNLPDLVEMPDVPKKVMEAVKGLPADISTQAYTLMSSPGFGYMTDVERTKELLSIPEVRSHVLKMLQNDPEVYGWLSQAGQFQYRKGMTQDPNVDPYSLIGGSYEYTNPITGEKRIMYEVNPYNPFAAAISGGDDYAYSKDISKNHTRTDAWQIAQWQQKQKEEDRFIVPTGVGLTAQGSSPYNALLTGAQNYNAAKSPEDKKKWGTQVSQIGQASFSNLLADPGYVSQLKKISKDLGYKTFGPKDAVSQEEAYYIIGKAAEEKLGGKIKYFTDADKKKIPTITLGKIISNSFDGKGNINQDLYSINLEMEGYARHDTYLGRQLNPYFNKGTDVDNITPLLASTDLIPKSGWATTTPGGQTYQQHITGDLQQINSYDLQGTGNKNIKGTLETWQKTNGQGLVNLATQEPMQKWLGNKKLTNVQIGSAIRDGQVIPVFVGTYIGKKGAETVAMSLDTQSPAWTNFSNSIALNEIAQNFRNMGLDPEFLKNPLGASVSTYSNIAEDNMQSNWVGAQTLGPQLPQYKIQILSEVAKLKQGESSNIVLSFPDRDENGAVIQRDLPPILIKKLPNNQFEVYGAGKALPLNNTNKWTPELEQELLNWGGKTIMKNAE